MSMMLASGLMVNITPRQTAGADGPKSVRNVMTGRIGGWYQGDPARRGGPRQGPGTPKRRREEDRRRFDLTDRLTEEGAARRSRWMRFSGAWSGLRPRNRTNPRGPWPEGTATR